MEYRSHISQTDWIEAQKFIQSSATPKNGLIDRSFEIVAIAILCLLIYKNRNSIDWALVGLLLIVTISPFVKMLYKQSKIFQAFTPKSNGVILGERTIKLTPSGISEIGTEHETFFKWSAVQRIEETSNLHLIFIDSALAIFIKKSDIQNKDMFFNFIKQHAINLK